MHCSSVSITYDDEQTQDGILPRHPCPPPTTPHCGPSRTQKVPSPDTSKIHFLERRGLLKEHASSGASSWSSNARDAREVHAPARALAVRKVRAEVRSALGRDVASLDISDPH